MINKWEKTKLKKSIVIVLFLFLVIGYFFIEYKAETNKAPYHEEMLAAETLMLEIIDYVSDLRVKQSIGINTEIDPNETGLIGSEFSEITTTLGDIEAKRTSTNPEFAALMVYYFAEELSLQEGDKVAVGASGSFPALLIATMVAGEVLDLELKTIYSLGSSHYGANIIGFTMADNVPRLQEDGYITNGIDAVSLGGGRDIGAGMYLDTNELKKRYLSERWEFIYEPNISANQKKRLKIYEQDYFPKAFVNIGGNIINYGTDFHDSGLLSSGDIQGDNSLIDYFLSRDVPVINLLNIKGLAEKHSIEVDPQPFLEPGKSDLYYFKRYPQRLAALMLGIYFSLLIFFKTKVEN